ncbi:phosphoethanolamine transferase [Prevotella sp. HCN-7019]|uniref:phosphoethanolamine transferase n=1 Tax=Prevotella sp. HCN-7019 TaxID=3134668 RepID=UPI0030BEB026
MKHFKKTYDICTSPHVLFTATIIALALPNIVLAFTESVSFTTRIANVILPVAVYWFLMTLSRKTGKMVWILFPLIFFAAFQMVLLYLFGRSVIAVDMFLNLVTTNPGEATELLNNLLPAVAGVIVVYLPLLVFAICSMKARSALSGTFIKAQRKYSVIGIVVGVISLNVCIFTDKYFKTENDIYPVNVCYNLVLAIERSNATAKYEQTSAGFSFNASSVHPADSSEVYVLVIGETARAASFGIYGYNRDTTPLMKHIPGLTAFNHALTQSNTTHKSVPMLLSAADASNYDRIYRERSIITAFREAGFHTAFFSNQKPNHSFIDIFGMEANDWKFIKNGPQGASNTPDEELLPLIAKKLSEGHKKLFIVIHTYGSHFNYRERYPASMAFFKPDNATEAKAVNRPQLINAYDNTIRQTDRLLAEIISMLGKSGAMSAMLYTSDHGENIFDDSRKLFLHASPVPSYYDLHVPFIVWTSQSYITEFPNITKSLTTNRTKDVENSVTTFHTMLHLAGIKTKYRRDSLSVASRHYFSGRRHYLNDHNLPVTLDKTGMNDEDFEMFRLKGINGI